MDTRCPPLKTLLIADSRSSSSIELTKGFSENGYKVFGCLPERRDILQTIQSLTPHVAILPYAKGSRDQLDIIEEIVSRQTTAVVVILKEWDASIAQETMNAGVSGYLVHPFSATSANITLESAWHFFCRLVELQKTLELRKLLERAKGLLMKNYFITEEEAHQRILRRSQDQCVPLKEVCELIINSKKELLTPEEELS